MTSKLSYLTLVVGVALAVGGLGGIYASVTSTQSVLLWGVVEMCGVLLVAIGATAARTDGEQRVNARNAVEKTDSRFGR